MPNPITQARKLGFPLVSKDGFLTGLAKMAAGVSPMDQIKNVLEARKRFDEDTARELENAGKATSNKAAEYNLNRAPIEDAQRDTVFGEGRTVFNQSQAERAARGAKLAGSLVPGPPNPDGSPIISPDAALGMAEGQKDIYNLQNANPNEVLSPELADMLGGSFKERAGQPVDRSQLQQGIAVQSHRDAAQARLDALRESAANRADARSGQMEMRRESINMGHGRDFQQEIKPLIVVTNAARRAETLANYIKANPQALGVGSEAIVADWERQLDPMSVIREGEFTRALAGTPYASQAEVFVQRLTGTGGHLTPKLLKQFVDLIQVAAQYARQRGSARYKDYLSLVGGDKRFIGDDPFNEGFDSPAGAASTVPTAPAITSMPPGATARRQNFLKD